MHLITGLLIAGILGKKRHKTLLPMLRTGPVQTAHYAPGRVRFRVPSLTDRSEGADLVQHKLPTLQGVKSVELNRRTGSILIRYSEEQIQPELLFAATVRLLGLDGELQKTQRPVVVKEVRAFIDSLNRSVYDRTAGLLDFNSALLIVLAAWGIKKLVAEGAGAVPAGLTLTWWGLNRLLGTGRSDAMNFLSRISLQLCRVKVVHRLPGRLRLRIPAAKRISVERHDLVDLVSSLLALPEPICAVSLNATTGSLLIQYDVQRVSEREVLAYLSGIVRLFMRHSARLSTLSPEEIVKRKPRFEEIVKAAVRHRLVLDTDLEVPEDVLA